MTVQDRVIVRTSYSNTPPSGGKAASRHDDLMVIYDDAGLEIGSIGFAKDVQRIFKAPARRTARGKNR